MAHTLSVHHAGFLYRRLPGHFGVVTGTYVYTPAAAPSSVCDTADTGRKLLTLHATWHANCKNSTVLHHGIPLDSKLMNLWR